jgi:hypothetical protein
MKTKTNRKIFKAKQTKKLNTKGGFLGFGKKKNSINISNSEKIRIRRIKDEMAEICKDLIDYITELKDTIDSMLAGEFQPNKAPFERCKYLITSIEKAKSNYETIKKRFYHYIEKVPEKYTKKINETDKKIKSFDKIKTEFERRSVTGADIYRGMSLEERINLRKPLYNPTTIKRMNNIRKIHTNPEKTKKPGIFKRMRQIFGTRKGSHNISILPISNIQHIASPINNTRKNNRKSEEAEKNLNEIIEISEALKDQIELFNLIKKTKINYTQSEYSEKKSDIQNIIKSIIKNYHSKAKTFFKKDLQYLDTKNKDKYEEITKYIKNNIIINEDAAENDNNDGLNKTIYNPEAAAAEAAEAAEAAIEEAKARDNFPNLSFIPEELKINKLDITHEKAACIEDEQNYYYVTKVDHANEKYEIQQYVEDNGSAKAIGDPIDIDGFTNLSSKFKLCHQKEVTNDTYSANQHNNNAQEHSNQVSRTSHNNSDGAELSFNPVEAESSLNSKGESLYKRAPPPVKPKPNSRLRTASAGGYRKTKKNMKSRKSRRTRK